MAIKKSQLYSTLWESCNALRGSMDASQYKDYVLMVLFVKYLSDKAKLGQTKLVIPEGCHFDDFILLKQNIHIGEEINKKLEAIREANAIFIGDLTLPNFNDPTKLGEGKTMVETLSKLIGVFQRNELDFSLNRTADDDLLGDAYEYLMKNFAAESGKSKGQFYTPAEVSRVIAKVLHLEDLKRASDSIYDPTCGSGSLLLRALAETPRGNVSLRGQEKDSTTASLAKLNMLLHNIITAKIEIGDTLNDPKFIRSGMLDTFDVCVANPPFSQKNWMAEGGESDEYNRWKETLLPPAKCGDYAFLLHLIASMRPETGRGACILPHGVLFRGNAEYEIRKDLINKHLIKGIIGLPANIFFGTGIPASIIIIDKKDATSRDGIFIIDAKDGYMKDGAKNRLREQDIKRIVDTWNDGEEIPHYSRMVPYSEIIENDYNLNIPRYITPKDTEIHQDIMAHLNGGLPASDVDGMDEYWKVCTTLKDSLFCECANGYYSLAVKKDEIQQTIADDKSFNMQKEMFGISMRRWTEHVEPHMLSIGKGVAPKSLIAEWSNKLLEVAKEDKSLVDAYSVYDRLMNYWAETMQDDCYMISNDGWKVNLLKPEKKRSFIYSDLVCDLLPVEIVIDEYFSKQLREIETAKGKYEELLANIDSHLEENAEFFEEFDKVNESAVKKALNNKWIDKATKAVFEKYVSLCAQKKPMAEDLAKKQATLTDMVMDKYEELTEDEIKTLVVKRKWTRTVVSRCEADMDAITQGIASAVTELVERYETPLPRIESDVEDLEEEVKGFLKEMGF